MNRVFIKKEQDLFLLFLFIHFFLKLKQSKDLKHRLFIHMSNTESIKMPENYERAVEVYYEIYERGLDLIRKKKLPLKIILKILKFN